MGGKTTPLTDDQRASILDMFHEGATRRDIATAHGVSAGVVSKIVHAAGYSFPGNNGTRAATLARQLDLAVWHEQQAAELEHQANDLDAEILSTLERERDHRRLYAALTGAGSRQADKLRDRAAEHAQKAERLRHAARLRDMPDEDWPHVLAMAEQAARRGRLPKPYRDALAAEFRRRRDGLDELTWARIRWELEKVRQGR